MFRDLIKDILEDISNIESNISQRQNIVKRCPLCNVEFKVLNIKFPDGTVLKIEQCPECSALWFDKGELTKALEISLKDIEKFFPSVSKKSIKGSGKRICPVCSSSMRLVNYSMDSNIWVDVCSCGIFLDAGELELIKLYSLNPKTTKFDYVEDISYSKTPSNLSSSPTSITPRIPPTSTTSTASFDKNVSEIINEVNLIKQDIEDLKKSILNKVKTFENKIKEKDLKYLLAFYKDPFKEEKIKLNTIKNRINVLKVKVNNLSINDKSTVEEIINYIDSLEKFILNRENSINIRVEELKIDEENKKKIETVYKTDKTEILQSQTLQSQTQTVESPKQTLTTSKQLSTSEISTTASSVFGISSSSLDSSSSLKDATLSTPSSTSSTPTSNVFTSISKSELDKDKLISLKVNKIKLSFYVNFLNYFTADSNSIIILSDSKLFLLNLNTLTKDKVDLKEIKSSYLSLRFKNISFIDNKIYILGTSGQILQISDLNNLLNNLELNQNNSVLYKVGYGDINNLLKFNSDKYLIITNGKLYLVDSNFKVLQEKSINIVNGINYNGNLIFSNSSGEILYLDNNLEIKNKLSTQSFYAIKSFKVLNNSLFGVSSGFIVIIEGDNIRKISLPKSFIEVNDISYIKGIYFIVGSSGALLYTLNLKDIFDYNTGIYDSINSIIKINDSFILLLCNNATFLSVEF